MLRTIIVDDEKSGRELLRHMLEKHCPDIRIVSEAGSVTEGIAEIEKHQPDLVFLDVELRDGTSFDILGKIPAPKFNVIFVTAYNQYATKAFKFSALDYLLKPVDDNELIDAVKKASDKNPGSDIKAQVEKYMEQYRMEKNSDSPGKLGISSLDGYEFIDISTIIRCEADGKYTTCYLTDGNRIVSSRGIKEFEEQLTRYNFFRVHHSYLINLKYIKKYYKGRGGYVIMSDDTSVPVAERKKEEFLNSLQRI